MPEGPFGFPRLTNFGPFVEHKINNTDKVTRDEVDFDKRDWITKTPTDISAKCENYFNIDPPIEFMIPISEATPVGYIDYPTDDIVILRSVAEVNEEYSDSYIGIHETPQENVDDILEDGFSKEMFGEQSIRADLDVRKNSVFTWHFIWDINLNDHEQSAIITVAPRESVTASDMASSITVPVKRYLEEFVMPYKQYIRCLRRYKPASPIAFESDIVQELPRSI